MRTGVQTVVTWIDPNEIACIDLLPENRLDLTRTSPLTATELVTHTVVPEAAVCGNVRLYSTSAT